ncbi:hypothetical protein V1504DRAFT_446912 [Lipomyces starkeyi]
MIDIAILELKNTKVIHWNDFVPARTNQRRAKAMRNKALTFATRTHFIQNAYWLSKQAKKYYRSVHVPDIAIFDWNSLFIFDFAGLDEDAQDPILARGIWFTESGSNPSEGETFRTVLFGFLIRALKRYNIIE